MASRVKLIGMGVVVAIAIGMTGCQNRDYVRWDESGAPATVNARTNEAVYTYVYFPELQVYLEPHSQLYFWFQDGAWYEGNVLPAGLSIDKQYFEFVELNTPKPWTQHVTVHSGFGGDYLPGSIEPLDDQTPPSVEITSVDPGTVYE